jgi:hypothetical protein
MTTPKELEQPNQWEHLAKQLEELGEHPELVPKVFTAMNLGIPLEWRDEQWCNFYVMADEIRRCESVSRGVAERTLRELCATGDVRSIKFNGDDAMEEYPSDVELIRPSEWVKDQVDLAVGEEIWVYVSEADAEYWLDKQAQVAGRPPMKHKFTIQEYKEYLEEKALKQTAQEPSSAPIPATGRTSRKQALARTAIKHLWPQGPPQELTNPQIEKQVDQWISVHCHKNNIPKPDIGRDTILRAAGRRQ